MSYGWVANYRAADYKGSLLLPSHPLHHPIGALSERISRRGWTSNAIELKQRCYPCQGDKVTTDAVMDFEVGQFGMHTSMQCMIQRYYTIRY
jgi:hypothetical protein